MPSETAIEIMKLTASSKRLEKLTEELSKSSKALERYTAMLIVLTILLFVFAFAGMLFPPDYPILSRVIVLLVIFVLVMSIFPKMFLLKKKE
jgi:membrane protein YdbS with pleckstrin-like domain